MQVNSAEMTPHIFFHFFCTWPIFFVCKFLKFYPNRLPFIFFAFPNFNPGEHQSAQKTTTHKGPNMPHSKCHVSLWRPYILWKRLWLIWVIPLHQSVCQVLKNPKRMHQEWPSVVVVAQGRCLRPDVAGAEGLVSQLHCFRLAKGFWGLGGYIGSICPEGICRSWKNEFHSGIAELEPWRHFSCIDLYMYSLPFARESRSQWMLAFAEREVWP